jgi:hypothetical protein
MKPLKIVKPTVSEDGVIGIPVDKMLDIPLRSDNIFNEKIEGQCINIQVRACCEFSGKGFYLDKSVNWVLGTDSENVPVLIPLKK